MKRAQRNPLLHAARQRVRPHLEGLHIYWRGLRLLVASASLPAAAYLALIVLWSLVPVMQVWLLKRLVDVLSAPLQLAGGQGVAIDGGLLIVLAVLYLLTLVIPGGLQPFYDNLEAIIKERVIVEVDRRIMQASARLVDLRRVEAPPFHDEVKLIRQSSYEVPQMLGMLSLGPGTMLTLGGLLLLLAQIHPVLPFLLLLVGIPYQRARRRMEAEKYRSLAENSRVAREMEYYTRLALEPAIAHEVRVFGLGAFLLRGYRLRRDRMMAEVQRLRLREFGQALAYSGVMALVLAAAFSYTALQASAGHLQVGDIALVKLLTRMYDPTSGLILLDGIPLGELRPGVTA
jgi:ATP-binding cassette, subfamily B, bacterial